MKAAWSIMVIAMLFLGCTRHTAAPPSTRISPSSQKGTKANGVTVASGENEDECEKWLNECIVALVRKQGSQEFEFHGIEANDVAFLPKTNAVEEILAQCQKVSARSDPDLKKYRVWLAARVGEMNQIKRGATRGKVKTILEEEGGLSTETSQIYSHKKCACLKLRVAYEPVPGSGGRFPYSAEDTVIAVSKPYLGCYIAD